MVNTCNLIAVENNENAKIAQLVEHDLAKVGVAGSSPVFRSKNNEISVSCPALQGITDLQLRK